MLSGILETEIFLPTPVCASEAWHLVEQQEVVQLALDKFLKGFITFSDYLDILETCEMSVDKYLINVENNLNRTGIIF